MTTDNHDLFTSPDPAELVETPDAGPAPVDFTQPGGADAGSVWEETGGRRKMPHPETGKPTWYTRASKIGGWIAETYTLTEWKIALAVAGVAHNRDLYAQANSIELPPIEERERGWWMPWAEIGHQGMDRIGASSGAHLGTAVHRFREQVDAGTREISDVPEEWRPHIEASERRRIALGMEIVHAEAFILNTKVHNGASGRLDNLLRGPDGRLVIEDLKTGKNVPMGLDEIAIQLAIYANADWLWDFASGTWLPMPNVRKDVAIVTWVPIDRPDDAETIIVDIAWGWAAATVAGWVQSYRNRSRRVGDSLRLPLEALREPERAPDPRTLLPGALSAVEQELADHPLRIMPAMAMNVDSERESMLSGERNAGAVRPAPAPDPTLDPLGSPLQPLADRAAGERGCSVCGRKGHRKGSPKCWAENDPAVLAQLDVTRVELDVADKIEAMDAAGVFDQPGVLAPLPPPWQGAATDPANMFDDQRPDAVPDADEEHWVTGKPLDDAASKGATWCVCTNRAAGWTRNPDTDTWVCGDCGLPSRAALMHEAAGRPARPAELSAFTADEAANVLSRADELEQHTPVAPISDRASAQPIEDGDAMTEPVNRIDAERERAIDREMSDGDHDTRASAARAVDARQKGMQHAAYGFRIEAASTLADLSALYMELYPAGAWTPELDALANRRKAEIKGEVAKLRSV